MQKTLTTVFLQDAQDLKRIMWISEEKNCVAMGAFGLNSTHTTYHEDGNYHFSKTGQSYHFPRINKRSYQEIIESNSPIQLRFTAVPLNQSIIDIATMPNRSSKMIDYEIVLERRTFLSDQIAICSWILPKNIEAKFIKELENMFGDLFKIIKVHTHELTFHKELKLALVFLDEKIATIA